ncbi:MAG: hypothetical protein RLZZ214_1694 [Verrucomicrobiota bacterium]
MKLLTLLLALSTVSSFAQTTSYKNIVRQTQQKTGVVWDMQDVTPNGSAASTLLLEDGGSLFQLWTIDQVAVKDHLLDQKLVGAYLPKADVKITTRDPYAPVTRTRIDQPFTVEIQVSDLLTGTGIPTAASKVLLEQHVQNYATGESTLDPNEVAANSPLATAYITENGKTTLRFAVSSLTAPDPTKATGEEHFIVHALADGAITQSQIASAKVQVWPLASGSITGISSGGEYRYQIPTIQLDLIDLYPRSDTYFVLYEGTAVTGAPGTLIKSYPWDSNTSRTTLLTSDELNSIITKDGTYTVALMSSTVFDTRLLCDPVSFTIKRSMTVNAMQVNFSDDTGH